MSEDATFHHHPFLQKVADEDVREVLRKDTSYKASWKMSGGRSAWFMLKRKIDRLVAMLGRPPDDSYVNIVKNLPVAELNGHGRVYYVRPETMRWIRDTLTSEDIFAKIAEGPGGEDGTPIAEVRDLRRYLLLVEAEMIARGVLEAPAARPLIPRHPEEPITVGAPSMPDLTMIPHNEARGSGEWDPGAPPGHDGADRAAAE